MQSYVVKSCIILSAAFALAMPPVAMASNQDKDSVTTRRDGRVVTPQKRADMVMLAKMRMDMARDPANTPLTTWSKLRDAQNFLGYGGIYSDDPEFFTVIDTTRDEFMGMLSSSVALVMKDDLITMNDPAAAGLNALGSVDRFSQGILDIQISTGKARSVILNDFQITESRLKNLTIDNAKISAQQTIEMVRDKQITGAAAWETLQDMPALYMARANLNPKSDASFKAIHSSLAEFYQLKRANALIAAKQLWELASSPDNAGESAVYYLEQAESYLRRAGYNTAQGDGFSQLNITKKIFEAFKSDNKNVRVAQVKSESFPTPTN